MGTFRLPPLQTGAPIVDPATGRPTASFINFWDQNKTALEASVNSTNSQLAALQSQQQQILAALQQANTALNVADAGGGTPGSQSGSTTISSPFAVNPGIWSNGPLVNLSSVAAGNLTFNETFSGSQPVSSNMSDTGNYRIQQIVGASETTVFTGNFALITVYGNAGQLYLIAVDESVTSWSGVNFPETSTGAVGYRLDFKLNTLTYNMSSAYLYVRRA